MLYQLHDLNQSPFFSISFGESLDTELQMFQMDVGLRLWNEKKGQIEIKYYDSHLFTHLTTENMYSSLEISMKGLDKAKLLQTLMDGPNVNWNVLNILDDKLESENFPKTFH